MFRFNCGCTSKKDVADKPEEVVVDTNLVEEKEEVISETRVEEVVSEIRVEEVVSETVVPTDTP